MQRCSAGGCRECSSGGSGWAALQCWGGRTDAGHAALRCCGCSGCSPALTAPHVLQYVELRTRYSELTTLSSHYIKFITETLRRMEHEEVLRMRLQRCIRVPPPSVPPQSPAKLAEADN